ncbi:BgTH12-07990 [Blumeria graminis f. sp. triticale]|nr:BgTH12-07990 [Blumeria graminis f. sp. triticale]
METYRQRGPKTQTSKKLLLPLSFGPCSTSLLYILDDHLQGQYDRMNRATYELIVVHINLFTTLKDKENSIKRLHEFQSRFPRHSFRIINLEESLQVEDIDWGSIDTFLLPKTTGQISPDDKLSQMIGSIVSPTSRAEMVSILFVRLLVSFGRKNNCDTVLFGDSITKLAEKALTVIARGNGCSLQWQVSDGLSPLGISCKYPLRDLHKKEIIAFSLLATPPLDDLISRDEITLMSACEKSSTINDLMSQYFESVGSNYPSIVANVVRTCGKLRAVSSQNSTPCGLCGLPFDDKLGTFSCDSEISSSHQTIQLPKHVSTFCRGCFNLVSNI